jgi:lipoprotein-anchoring transpeptidase ErfK/SrfK
MNKFLLKILILCTVITGSFLAVQTNAQNTTSTTANSQLLVVARSEEKKVIINVSNINQKINVDYEIFKGTDKNAVGADRKKVTKIVNSSTKTATHTFENLTDANNWNVLVTAYKDTDVESTKQTGAATFSIPGTSAPSDPADVNISGSQTTIDTDTTYTPLAPISDTLGGCTAPDGTIIPNCIDTAEAGAFGKYFNALIRIFIGFCAVLAMIMIVVGGMQYMTSELVSGKEEAKKRIWGAVGGLILALASYAILNTLNPQLLDISLSGVAKAEITLDEKEFSKTERSINSVGDSYKLKGTFENPSPSPGVLDFKKELDKGFLNEIEIDTASKKATFKTGTAGNIKTVSIPINIGYNGVSETGRAVGGDSKTPKGVTKITSDRRPNSRPPIKNKAAVTRDGKYNLGAAFINIGATVNGKDRGIGFHGNAENTLGTTNGCIRMLNDDLVVLAPYMKTGVSVIIK